MMDEFLDTHSLPWRIPGHEVGNLTAGVNNGDDGVSKEGAGRGALTA
jgi:hypothetical protein